MAESVRLNKLIKRYRTGMDSVADYLLSLGIEVERTPNSKVPIDVLKQMDDHFGYVLQPKDYYIGYSASSSEVNSLMEALHKNHQQLLSLAEERRIGSYSEPYVEENRRILNNLTEIALSQKQEGPHIKAFVESLSSELLDLITEYRNHKKHKKAYLMMTDFVIKLRNRYLMAIDNMVADEVTDTIEVPWNRIRFGNGKLYLDIGKEKPLICSEPKSKETFNYFRCAFEERVKPIKVRIHSKLPPEIVETPEFMEVFQFLDIREDIRLGSFSRRLDLAKFIKDSKINFQDYLLPKDRGPYLQYLVEKQSPNHRFIPMYEKDLENEDAFLFTLKGRGMYIVWENINENTATYVFPITEANYDTILQAIYDYASSDVDYKRMRLHHGVSQKTIGTPCRIIYHNDLSQWKAEIASLLRR